MGPSQRGQPGSRAGGGEHPAEVTGPKPEGLSGLCSIWKMTSIADTEGDHSVVNCGEC